MIGLWIVLFDIIIILILMLLIFLIVKLYQKRESQKQENIMVNWLMKKLEENALINQLMRELEKVPNQVVKIAVVLVIIIVIIFIFKIVIYFSYKEKITVQGIKTASDCDDECKQVECNFYSLNYKGSEYKNSVCNCICKRTALLPFMVYLLSLAIIAMMIIFADVIFKILKKGVK